MTGTHAQQLYRIIQTYRLADRDPRYGQYLQMLERGQITDLMAQALLHQARQFVEYLRVHPNLLMKSPSQDQLNETGPPDFEFMTLEEGARCRYGIRLTDRPRHLLATGQSGAGKTSTLRAIVRGIDGMRNADGKRISMIVTDPKGGVFSDARQLMGDHWLHYSKDGPPLFSLAAPEGVPPNVWINVLATIFAARASIKCASITLTSIIKWLCNQLYPQPSEHILWPDLRLVLDVCYASPPSLWASKPEYQASLVQTLEGFVQGTGPLLQTFAGLDLERDIIQEGKSVVFDIPALYPPWIRGFIFDLLISQVLFSRIARHRLVDTTECVFIMDEADQDASESSQAAFPDQMSPLSLLLKQGRELGIACILAVTAIRDTSMMVLCNVQYTLCHNMSDELSLLQAKRTLLLPPGAEAMLPGLKPGEALFRESQGAWPHPMLVKVDYMPPNRTPLQEFDTFPSVPSKRLAEMPELQAALAALIAEHRATRMRQARQGKPALSELSRKVLDLASIRPCVPVARLFNELGKPSPTAQASARKALEEQKLSDFTEVRMGRRNVLLIRLTDEGWSFLGKQPPRRKGRGDIPHWHICQWLCWLGEQRGCKTATEWIVPGTNHPVDAVWQTGKETHVFEAVVGCEDNLISHLTACFITSDAVDRATIVAPQKSKLSELKAVIDAEPTLKPFVDRIEYLPAESILSELWP
ncbi:hypothetical protein [Anaerobaca lacustris]|uniref:ATP-binding protein n=1 Tax=Anaerobaca lacustris TaxID=3044600 RepID=A0AAW6U4Z2_9BACT|nr:hypothetical protein [Sedimentisphaerales bacterium M17dextr]